MTSWKPLYKIPFVWAPIRRNMLLDGAEGERCGCGPGQLLGFTFWIYGCCAQMEVSRNTPKWMVYSGQSYDNGCPRVLPILVWVARFLLQIR